MGSSKEQEKPSTKTLIGFVSLLGLVCGQFLPSEQDFSQLADELAQKPPPELDTEALSLVVRILKGE